MAEAASKKAPKFLKAGKVVLLLNGRMAGKKAVIVKTFDDGTPDRQYGYCLVAGIQKYPLKISKSMTEKKIAKRSKVRACGGDCPYSTPPATAGGARGEVVDAAAAASVPLVAALASAAAVPSRLGYFCEAAAVELMLCCCCCCRAVAGYSTMAPLPMAPLPLLSVSASLIPSLPLPCRRQVKPFIKVVNYTHLMPTRYALEAELKSIVTTDLVNGSSANPTARQNARKEVKKMFEEKYNNSLKTGKNKWFFQKLRF